MRLSRSAVLDAAASIIAEEGVEALTMRRVAARLGTAPMSLYRHVRDKDDLLVALLDRLAPAEDRAGLPAQPRARVLAACRLMRDALAEHPWVVEVLARGDLIAPSVLWLVDEIVAGLLACGLDEAAAVAGYRAIWQFTVGELLLAHGAARLRRPPHLLAQLEDADAGELPALASVAPRWRTARTADDYEHGLAALVDGLREAAS